MEDEIVQMDAGDDADLGPEMADGELIAGKKTGDGEDGIIAILIG
jgi:hypothetical protein